MTKPQDNPGPRPPQSVDLSSFSNKNFDRGASRLTEGLWLLVRAMFFRFCPFPASRLRRWWLRRFGATVGRGVVIKPGVKITFPWKLRVGDFAWLGEDCWLLNLDTITLEDHVCVSQRALLCTGNHDYRSPSFDLRTAPIVLRRGAWVAADASVGPGVTVGEHAVLSLGSVATEDLAPWGVYRGNPARKIHTRRIDDALGASEAAVE